MTIRKYHNYADDIYLIAREGGKKKPNHKTMKFDFDR